MDEGHELYSIPILGLPWDPRYFGQLWNIFVINSRIPRKERKEVIDLCDGWAFVHQVVWLEKFVAFQIVDEDLFPLDSDEMEKH